MEFVLLEKNEAIGVITINRLNQLNALNPQVLEELNQTIDVVENDPSILCVMITGAGGKAFVAGADIAAMRNMKVLEAQDFSQLGQRIFNRIERMKKPVIAAIDGFALGGGCELALACDIRICSKKAKFGQPEVNLGIIPGFGGTQRLPRLIGKSKAMQLIFTGDIIDAEEALNLGLVDQVVSSEQLMSTATTLAKKIASKAPVAIEQAKVAINYAAGYMNEGYDYEASLFSTCFSTDDQKEGMKAFLEKRRPNFKGC
ncbi:MAG: enoyl-CoA hydratase [Candidatus Petromonas sp.]|jgi:enoyl-CoA hydratase|nr:enoyl-CoA hydratase [Candidatus Petromonas sp.]